MVEQVLGEYRSYVSSEFQARDRQLKDALEAAPVEAGFLAREPFFQTHRPFKSGRRWRDLGLDAALAGVMEQRSASETAYLHQSEAIAHIMGPDAGPLVVTTGTGLGKTERFPLPVIQNTVEDSVRFRQAGLTALLVVPPAGTKTPKLAGMQTGVGPRFQCGSGFRMENGLVAATIRPEMESVTRIFSS